MSDLIEREQALKALRGAEAITFAFGYHNVYEAIRRVPSAQLTLHGYDIEHLELIARVLQKEDLPPETIAEVLTDIGRIAAIIKYEFEETLRKAAEQCTI